MLLSSEYLILAGITTAGVTAGAQQINQAMVAECEETAKTIREVNQHYRQQTLQQIRNNQSSQSPSMYQQPLQVQPQPESFMLRSINSNI